MEQMELDRIRISQVIVGRFDPNSEDSLTRRVLMGGKIVGDLILEKL